MTEKQKSEVWKHYDTWLHAYLNADVKTYDAYFDDDYHFIGSTNNEEFLNRKSTTQFFEDTAEQLAGKCDLRNESKILETFGDSVILNHFFDAWFLNDGDYVFYGRFRFSSVLQKKKDGWRFVLQHFSVPDSKSDDGQTIGFENINEENRQLKEAIKRRTKELEAKNRELEIETALERIRAQAVAMKQSTDLLDIVVTLRNEFIKLGHEAHYFWHMMWLPEIYEKAMTSGDGSKIGFVMNLPRHMHGDIPQLAKWEKSKKPTVVHPMNVEEAIAYVDKMVALGDFKNIDPQAPTHDDIKHIGGLTFIMARTTHGEIGYSLPGVVKNPPKEDIDILIKFAGAFDLAHRRFLDIKNAEKQAREVEIQLALEKIRSRSLAVHKSEEFNEVISVVFEKLKELNIPATAVGIGIQIEGSKDLNTYVCGENEKGLVISNYRLPYFNNKISKDLCTAIEKQIDTYVGHYTKKQKDSFYAFVLKHTEEFKDLPEDILNMIFDSPSYTITMVASKHVVFNVNDFEGKELSTEDIEIVKRVSKVFNQAYTRFLDLQKAEAQTRVAQIEAALERVRSASLAMHKTDELANVVGVLFSQFAELQLEFYQVWINIFLLEEGISNCWFSRVHGVVEEPYTAVVPLAPFEDTSIKSWKAGEKFSYLSWKGKKEVDKIMKDLSKMTCHPSFEQIQKKKKMERMEVIDCNHKYGVVALAKNSDITKEDHIILERFTNVFEQAYTRFLDLQKAEEQAREKAVELALEKVRSRTMAMHGSDELTGVGELLYSELSKLGLVSLISGYVLMKEDGSYGYNYTVNPVDGSIRSEPSGFPLTETKPLKALRKSWRNQEPNFVIELNSDETIAHQTYIAENSTNFPIPKEKLLAITPERLVINSFNFPQGFLLIVGGSRLSDEQTDMVGRFSKAFEMAYRRFMDLKKAEERARETAIELALEKVRSRTMAMQHSDELAETSLLLFEQFKNLGDISDQISIGIINEEAKLMELYSTVHGKQWKDVAKVDLNEPVVMKKIHTGWKKKKKSLVIDLKGTELKKYNNYRKKLSNLTYEEKRWVIHVAFFSNGVLTFSSTEQYPPETTYLLERFASVFDGTYRRFLDLKKAEAQAREAQIEAALERVRSRSMAMHNSEELKDVIQVLYDQFIQLNVTIEHAGFILDYKENDDMHIWLADHNAVFPKIVLPYFDCAHWNDFVKAKKTGQKFFANQLDFKEKNKFYNDLFKHIPDLPEETKATYLGFKGLAISTVLLDSVGLYIENYKGIPFSDEENAILMRFGTVFQQSYTRFLDLQKAEAQAREAKIETALERVRSRSMAMHSSHELSSVVDTLQKEFSNLDFNLTFCIINLINEEDMSNTVWAANPETGKPPESYYMKFEDYPFHHTMWEAWKAQKKRFVYVLEGEEKKTYDKYLYTKTEFKRFPKHVQKANKNLERYVAGFTFFKYSGLQTVSENNISQEDLAILERFGRVFEQAYTRFLDLQQAEEQARKSQIELSLERIRSQVTSMQASSDLFDIVVTMRKEFLSLGHEADYFWHMKWGKDAYEMSMTAEDGGRLGMVITVPKFVHEDIKSLAAWEKSKKPSFVLALNAEDAWDYIDNMNTHGHYKQADPNAPSKEDIQHIGGLTFVIARTTHGELGFSLAGKVDDPPKASIDLLERFAQVFDLAYKRFEDLQKAEHQTRETQIELALEKVRSRSMAMQKSEEIGDVAFVLFEQLKSLGGELWGTGFAFCKPDSKEDEFWFANENGIMPHLKIPNDVDEAHQKMYKGWKKKLELLSIEKGGKELKEHYKYMLTVPAVQPIFQGMMDNGVEFPTWQKWHAAYFKYGYILVITTKPYQNETIFKRFAKVFEQAYIRFLDLQKAEAQTREAQIEAALERVRSSSMAMHHTNELQNVINVVHSEFSNLQIDITGGVFLAVNNEITAEINCWGAGGTTNYIERVHIPFLNNKIYTGLIKGIKKGPGFFTENYSKALKKKFFNHLFKHPPYSDMPESHKAEVLSRPGGYTRSCATSKNTSIFMINHHGRDFSEQDNEILKRFGIVFEQTYTRFLDLQKAEAQAREAQIEAALERVRSKSMAMHKSEELRGVVNTLYGEFQNLQANFNVAVIQILDDTKDLHLWVSTADGLYDNIIHWPYANMPHFNEMYKAWTEQIPLAITLSKTETQAFFDEYFKIKAVPEDRRKAVESVDHMDIMGFYQNHTGIFLMRYTEGNYSEEEKDITQRFSKVFEQTYIRFLDLQKAEAQTREAQINLAVERVRAKALAMHKSEEIMEVVATLKDEITGLDIPSVVASTIFLEAENDKIRMWDLSSLERSDKGYLAITDITFQLKKKDPNLYIKRVWENPKDYFVEVQNSKDLDRIIEFMYENNQFEIAKEVEDYTRSTNLTKLYHASKQLNNGKLCIDLLEPPPEEMEVILNKIGAAFDLAYKRFEDLQKAEAQAREAQIETALEKVRSRTMAMQHSEELPEAANVLFTEVQNLGIPAWSCGYNILSTDKKSSTCIMSSEGEIQTPFTLPLTEHKSLKPWHNAILNNEQFFVYEQGDKDLEEHYDYMQSLPDLKETFKQLRDADIPLPTFQVNHLAKFTNGFLLFITYERVPEAHDIFQRFAKVFEQTYTRFLDLKKAEAQAREAQIEAALEKVRSRSLAMHKSDEMQMVVDTIYEQLKILGFEMHAVGMSGAMDAKKGYEVWAGGIGLTEPLHIPYNEKTKVQRDYNKVLIDRIELFTKTYSGKIKKEYIDFLLDNNKFPAYLEKLMLESKAFTTTLATSKNSGIQILRYTDKPYSDNENNIAVRFAKVYEQAYIRFMDLQKAEAQARESRIQLALERVRARTMAMQSSEELVETSELLFQQIKELGIDVWSCGYSLWYDDDSYFIGYNPMPDGKMGEKFKIPLTEDIFFKTIRKGKRDGKDFIVFESKGKSLAKTYDYMDKLPVVGEGMRAIVAAGFELPKFQVTHCGYFSHGHLMFITHQHYPDAIDIFKRFTKEFEQTYTRFLDLQKAEAQTRKAQIEASLERVRAKAMAMHDSNELDEVLSVLCEQFDVLGIVPMSTHMTVFDFENNTFTFRETGKFGNRSFGEQTVALDAMDNWKETVDKWKADEATAINKLHFPKDQLAEVWKVFHESFASMPEGSRITPEDYPDGIYHTAGKHPFGYIGMNQTRPATEEEEQIVIKFANEFGMAYQRFLDLQKAEAQAHEAKIEAALERVRSQSMGMQSSNDFSNVTTEMFDQLRQFGGDLFATGIVFCDKHDGHVEQWHSIPNAGMMSPFIVPIDLDYIHQYRYDEWKKGTELFEIEIPSDFIEQHFRDIFNLPSAQKVLKDLADQNTPMPEAPPWEIDYGASFKHGYLLVSSLQPFTETEMLPRFAKVFEQAYIRFLDLKKAEAQTREAQIETALEKVRSRTMAMHSSLDVGNTMVLLFEELESLGIKANRNGIIILDEDEEEHGEIWTAKPNINNVVELISWKLDMSLHDLTKQVYSAWKNKNSGTVYTLIGDDLKAYYKVLNKYTDIPVKFNLDTFPEKEWCYTFNFNEGFIYLFIDEKMLHEYEQIPERFASVFGQTYRRYQDLQKAEAQAREAEIEAALERIRSRSMAMHKTDELSEVIVLLFGQLELLDLVIDTCYIDIFDEDNQGFNIWVGTGTAIYPEQVHLPYFKHPIHQLNKKARQNNVEFFNIDEDEKSKDLYFEHFYAKAEGIDVPKKRKEHIAKGLGISGSAALGEHAGITMWNYRKIIYSREENEILNRVNKVFQQTYTRFLDLQKAEAQARESQIEAALEKVRSRSLAMHTTDELQEVVALIAEKLRDLGVIFDAGGVILCTYFPDNKDVMHWIAAEDFSYSGNYLVPYFDTTIFNDTWESKNRGDTYFSKEFSVKDKNSFFEYAFEHSDYKHFPDAFKQHALEAKNHRITAAWSKNSAILIPSFGIDEPSESDADILKRFAKVFEQAYIRFMDLQKAEERAREIQIDMALERVRSRTMGMQKSDELAETSSVLFQQIKELASETWSCGFCIWQDNDNVELWMGADSGGLLPPMLIPYKKEPTHREIYEASLQKESSYNKVWNGKALKEHYAFLRTIPSVAKAIKVMEDSGLTLPKQQCYYVGFFEHGYLLLITEEPNDNLVDLSQRFTKVFDLTYTRFLDLQLREKQAVEILNEKQRLEKTLSELQTTQKQLIQSEKMASLGELTAGIAHEIQNPLNFVNNFSEVSKELLEEMQEELDNGDMEEVKAIMEDIIQNLDKINHHGKRADGIVKGMLQHSRASGDKKEATDINKLADEYMRLAYHGLRAKNKQFNATLNTNFNENLPKIKVIPQDIGRVILNLFTNAFYAVDEKKSIAKDIDYEPTVSVATKQLKNTVEIMVTDNGNGIPKHVLDKIFQPFFTTKPTGQGTGLGLSMSYDIITKGHGGTLDVETNEGKGTEFIIKLPLKLS